MKRFHPLAVIVDAIKSTLRPRQSLGRTLLTMRNHADWRRRAVARVDQLVEQETGMPVHVADSPLDCVGGWHSKRLRFHAFLLIGKARR